VCRLNIDTISSNAECTHTHGVMSVCIICGRDCIEEHTVTFDCKDHHTACGGCVKTQWVNYFKPCAAPCCICRGVVFPRTRACAMELHVSPHCQRCKDLLTAMGIGIDNGILSPHDHLALPWEIKVIEDDGIVAKDVFPRVIAIQTTNVQTYISTQTCSVSTYVHDNTATMFECRRSMLKQREKD